MIEAVVVIQIAKPIATVFEYTINPLNAKEWYDNVVESTCEAVDGNIQVGVKANLKTDIMGKVYDFTYNIDQLIPQQKMLMTSVSGPFPMESEYTFRAINADNTEVTIINRATPKGVPSFLVSMVKGKVQKTIAESVEHLKTILESK